MYETVQEFEEIWCNEMVTQVANCIEDEAEDPLIVPSGTCIFAMPCSWLHVNMMCSARYACPVPMWWKPVWFPLYVEGIVSS